MPDHLLPDDKKELRPPREGEADRGRLLPPRFLPVDPRVREPMLIPREDDRAPPPFLPPRLPLRRVPGRPPVGNRECPLGLPHQVIHTPNSRIPRNPDAHNGDGKRQEDQNDGQARLESYQAEEGCFFGGASPRVLLTRSYHPCGSRHPKNVHLPSILRLPLHDFHTDFFSQVSSGGVHFPPDEDHLAGLPPRQPFARGEKRPRRTHLETLPLSSGKEVFLPLLDGDLGNGEESLENRPAGLALPRDEDAVPRVLDDRAEGGGHFPGVHHESLPSRLKDPLRLDGQEEGIPSPADADPFSFRLRNAQQIEGEIQRLETFLRQGSSGGFPPRPLCRLPPSEKPFVRGGIERERQHPGTH